MNYILKLYDEPLIKFTMSNSGSTLVCNILWQDKEKQHLMPIDFDGTNELLAKWLKRRVVPKNRAYVHSILHSMGLSHRDTIGIISLCKGLSLNDAYWVVTEDFNDKFADYNLYENRFADALALAALTGESLSENKAKKIKTSPEFTTNGMLPKVWRHLGDKIILFKGGIWREYAETDDPLEPYSEFYAYQIAHAMSLSAVEYGIMRWKKILGSTCELFTDINTAYIPIWQPTKLFRAEEERENQYLAVSKWYKEYDNKNGTDFYNDFASMLLFDAIVYNEDRHFGNFGLLRNNHTGELINTAPIFDNGISLFNYSTMSELRKLDEHRKTYDNFFKQPFEIPVKEFCGIKQKEQLQKLIGFKFSKHKTYNWPKERKDIIENYIQIRIKELLDIISD